MLGGVHRFGPLVQQRETTTASPTSLIGMAPGTGHGQRSRSKRSSPVNSSMLVRQSTRSTPSHKVSVCV
ncbi:Uncharacterised protein [Mycobacterium tuberculosis]|nr:Uncharacterised protein [Mycobacterium tuberculosis]